MKESRTAPAQIATDILSRASKTGWRDFDPYDGISGWGSWLPDRPILLKRLMTQLVMRTPPSMRPAFGIAPHLEAYTLGVLLSTTAALGMPSEGEHTRSLIDVLLDLHLPGGGWGYSFPVVTRSARYVPDDPNVISTVFAGLGLLDWIETGGNAERAEGALSSAASWLRHEAWDEAQCTFRYHSGNREVIHNASILAALFLARAGRLLGIETDKEVGQSIDRVIAVQRSDGSWSYGRGRRLDWVDNHHTGFMLKALLLLPEPDWPTTWSDAVIHGLDFYDKHLFTPDGRPKASTSSEYPADSLAAGQAIETFALASVTFGDERYLRRAHLILSWSESNLKRADGRYRFRIGRYVPWPGAYLRWGEAHIALGAARLSRLQA